MRVDEFGRTSKEFSKEIMEPSNELLLRVEKIIGSKPVSWDIVKKGYTVADRYKVKLEDDSYVFVKSATDEETSKWIRDEYKIYGKLKANFLPKLIGYEDSGHPVLILEDLSSGFWPPPWSSGYISRVKETLKDVAQTEPPSDLPSLERIGDKKGWCEISENPSGFLSLKLVSQEWLDKNLIHLLKAEEQMDLKGNSLVHCDVRSDNICFIGERTLLVDWNWASIGNPALDLISWLPSLHSEDGPAPWEITVSEPELIAWVAGYFASHAYLPPHKQGSSIRELQLAQLKSALPWAARALNLSLPA